MSADQLIERLRVLRIVIAAMAGGLFAFTAMAVALATGGSIKDREELSVILLIALGSLTLCEAIGYVVLRQGIIGKTRSFLQAHPDPDHPRAAIANAFATLTIVAGAMLEGLGLFGAVIVLVAGEQLALVASALAILLLLALVLPNEEKARNFAAKITG